MAWDKKLPQLLYAATDTGELLVFNTKTRVRSAGKTLTVCRHVQTLLGHQPYPLGVVTLKGFLLSASPAQQHAQSTPLWQVPQLSSARLLRLPRARLAARGRSALLPRG